MGYFPFGWRQETDMYTKPTENISHGHDGTMNSLKYYFTKQYGEEHLLVSLLTKSF